VNAHTELVCSAPAKINVALFVGPVREEDGRHDLVTVFQPVDLADLLTARLDPSLPGDVVRCPGVDGDNLALAALEAYRSETGWDGPPISIDIEKRIPIAGGMAGGSADAAAALRLVAAFAGDDDLARLERIATPLGADVPSQVQGRRVIATGAGEALRRSPAKPDWEAVILPIDAQLSAGAVYAEADRLHPPRDAEEMRELRAAVAQAEMRAGGVEHAGLAINDLQRAARHLCPEIDEALTRLRAEGAEHAMVSGSGPTVVGLFAPGDGEAAVLRIGADRPVRLALPEYRATLERPRWP
jgi:4-diphosphocytidyl-2-C-methyl-D-erythritol kinase